ncbi:ferritin family protein [Nanoarchaeota archaeon]
MSDIMLAWLQFAINVEKNGYEFYKLCLERGTDQRAKELFKWLVDEEIKHEKSLAEIRDKKSGGDQKKVDESIKKFNELGVDSPLFTKEDLDKVIDRNTSLMEMFNMCAEQEKKGIDLYMDLESQQEDPELKAFFHDLAKQEVVHRQKIVNVSMSLMGMETEEELESDEAIEKELASQERIEHPVTIEIKDCNFEPKKVIVNKDETVLLTIKSVNCPAGFRMVNFMIDEYIGIGKEVKVEFKADTAGEFKYFSNVPCSGGNAGMEGMFIIKGENAPDEDL